MPYRTRKTPKGYKAKWGKKGNGTMQNLELAPNEKPQNNAEQFSLLDGENEDPTGYLKYYVAQIELWEGSDFVGHRC